MIIIKRDAEKLAVLLRTVKKGAKVPQAMKMEDAAGQMGARFYPTKPQPQH